jgi:hypothetical protein
VREGMKNGRKGGGGMKNKVLSLSHTHTILAIALMLSWWRSSYKKKKPSY